MSNLFHKELNLAIPPISNNAILLEMHKRKYSHHKTNTPDAVTHQVYCFGFSDVDELLNPELLDVFKTLQVKPKVMCMFGSKRGPNYRTPAHGDVYHEAPGVWKSWPAGINYEFTVSDVDWYFYDPGNNVQQPVEEYDSERMVKDFPQNLASGSRWGNDSTFSQDNIDNLGFRLLETYSVKPKTYYLNRVDVPHSVDSRCKSSSERISVQIKFDINDIPTWERAVEVFKPLIAE